MVKETLEQIEKKTKNQENRRENVTRYIFKGN